ncbi:MAG TPA: tetratricopeptide repeat protein [Spirochaetota bacterium]|nr:tetratricopeptide repeat protein [Spirochaetota bacterium]
MGDSEERTAYTPEEQNEIDRILGLLPGEQTEKGPAEAAQVPPSGEPGGFEDELDLSSDLVELDETPPPASDEIEDITDIIEMVEEPPADEVADLEEIGFDEAAVEVPTEIEAPPGEEPAALEEAPSPPKKVGKARTSIEELDELTSMEPESVDLQDVSDDRYVEEAEAQRGPIAEEAAGPEESIDSFDMDLGPIEEPFQAPPEVHIEKEPEFDIGALSDISVEEMQDMPEAGAADIPEIDLGDMVPESDLPSSPPPAADFMGDFQDEGIPEPLSMEETPPQARRAAPSPDLDIGMEQEEIIPGIGRIEEAVSTEEIPDVEEEPPPEVEKPRKGRARAREEEEDDLSERDIKRLKKALLLFHPALRKAVKEAILNDILPPRDSRQLIDMILSGKSEESINRFLEGKLGRSIDISEGPAPGRRVLTSRPEYTREGLERQKRLFKATRIGAIAALAAFTVTILSYQFIYKPVMAKRLIKEGVALIREQGDPVTKKVKDYEKAETLFSRVDNDYAKDYLPGYNAYGRAYLDRREFELALGKLERANKINPVDIETLNNLGYFYSRVPEGVYNRIKKADEKESRLDKAIKYYKYVLNRKPGNETALYGIGNAYMHLGQYVKARQYYEDILKQDSKSVVGHSGLLNLYIERDVMPRVMSIHSDLVDKKMLTDLPSPLLGKLAAYYIGKKRTDSVNIRVDYGVQSTRFKDPADNPFPAAKAVLEALHQKDPHYAQQYVLYARLNRGEGNLKLMENYAEKACKEMPNYFAALHLLGEYHYLVKEPAKAYGLFREAVKAHGSPPDFTLEDFYYKTENLGNTYFLMGNIFYYFFDKVRYRFSDELEEEPLDAELEQQANYTIAREKYEAALKEGFESPELFYNLGRIDYMNGRYEAALNRWLALNEESVDSPEVMLAMGNAFYHLDNLQAGRGEYLKLISIFERQAESISKVFPDRADHVKIFQTLATAYNNLGAIYELRKDETRSNVSYWKAIDYAKRIDRENEFARVNMARAFKERSEPIRPILDENIPFSLGVYSKEMR